MYKIYDSARDLFKRYGYTGVESFPDKPVTSMQRTSRGLQDVAVGDLVLVNGLAWGDPSYIRANGVARVTKTLIVLDDGRRYKKGNGDRYGNVGRITFSYIQPVTDETVAGEARAAFKTEEQDRIDRLLKFGVSKLANYNYENLRIDQIAQLCAMLDRFDAGASAQ